MTDSTGFANTDTEGLSAKYDRYRMSRQTGIDSDDFCSLRERGATGVVGETRDHEDIPSRAATNRGGRGRVNPGLLTKAKSLVDTMDPDDDVALRPCLQDLAATLARMWRDSLGFSQPHEDILATLQRAVLEAKDGTVTPDQLRAFREAVLDLSQEHLTSEHANVIRSRFVDAGFGALSFIPPGSSEPSE